MMLLFFSTTFRHQFCSLLQISCAKTRPVDMPCAQVCVSVCLFVCLTDSSNAGVADATITKFDGYNLHCEVTPILTLNFYEHVSYLRICVGFQWLNFSFCPVGSQAEN